MAHRTRLMVAILFACSVVVGAVAPAEAAGGPVLESDEAAMDAALTCPDTFDPSDDREPLLLVHGTFATPEENWGWNYAAALPERGWDVCTVELPERSTVDIQVSAEYVVHAVRRIAEHSGERVDVMGHSQGGLQPRWAIRWWPDVRTAVDDLVMLATPNHGTVTADFGYRMGCFPSCYQMSQDSAFVAALNEGDETPGDVSYTSLYSLTDELVQPAAPEPTAAIDGATNILVQDLCPGRPVEHVGFAYDAAVYAMVVDALTRPGPADPARFDPLVCASVWFDGVDPSVFAGMGDDNALTDLFGAGPDGFGDPGAEPPLKPYARSSGGTGGSGSEGGDASGGGASGGDAAVQGASAGESTGPLPATGGLPAAAAAVALLAPLVVTTWRRRGSP